MALKGGHCPPANIRYPLLSLNHELQQEPRVPYCEHASTPTRIPLAGDNNPTLGHFDVSDLTMLLRALKWFIIAILVIVVVAAIGRFVIFPPYAYSTPRTQLSA